MVIVSTHNLLSLVIYLQCVLLALCSECMGGVHTGAQVGKPSSHFIWTKWAFHRPMIRFLY